MLESLSLDLAPLLPFWVLYILGGLALFLVCFFAYKKSKGWIWRCLAMCFIFLGICNVQIIEEKKRPLDDILLVMIDESESHSLGKRRQKTQWAVAALKEKLEPYQSLDVWFLPFGGDQNTSATENEGGTRLFVALRQALADLSPERLAAVLVISDGQIHDVPVKMEKAPSVAESTVEKSANDLKIKQENLKKDIKQLIGQAPMHLLLTGRDGEYDRRLEILSAPNYGLVGQDFTIRVKLTEFGTPLGRTGASQNPAKQETHNTEQVVLEIRQDGDKATTHRLHIGEVTELPLHLHHGGKNFFQLQIPVLEGELSRANNEALLSVNAVRDRLQVLLVSGEPHAGERSWRNLLKSDPAVDLVHFTILRPANKPDQVPIDEMSLIAFPIQELFEIKLKDFDLIIFDRYKRRGVLPQLYIQNIVDYVKGGGALLLAAGPDFGTGASLFATPLKEIFPAQPSGEIFETGFQPQVTPLGHRHPVTAGLEGANRPADTALSSQPQQAQWGRWFRHLDAHAVGGDVLMTGVEDRPLLLLDHVGEGRVAQILSDHMWLWDRGFEGGGPQAELLRRLSHWLMKEPDLEERDLLAENESGRLKVTRRSLEPLEQPVTLIEPDGDVVTLALQDQGDGRAIGYYDPPKEGLYRVEDQDRVALAAFGPLNPLEFKTLRSTEDILAPTIQASDGAVHRIFAAEGDNGPSAWSLPDLRLVKTQRDAFGRDWIGLRENQISEVVGVNERSLLPNWSLLLLSLGSLLLAWRREGQ